MLKNITKKLLTSMVMLMPRINWVFFTTRIGFDQTPHIRSSEVNSLTTKTWHMITSNERLIKEVLKLLPILVYATKMVMGLKKRLTEDCLLANEN